MVLMSTYNGEKYLREQIESILNQTGVNIKIIVRDDGSTDNTISILDSYKTKGLLDWYQGDNIKPAKSFICLIRDSEMADYYAFSDQDDYWLEDKLITAVNALDKFDMDTPALYYGQPLLVDRDLNPLEIQTRQLLFCTINQAVISSNATGCTMVFNNALRNLILEYTPNYQIMHDGWLHKVCLAVGGVVTFDGQPHIKYRQHGDNVIGGTSSFIDRNKRRLRSLMTDKNARSKAVSEIVIGYEKYMSLETLSICQKVANYRNSLFDKVSLLLDGRIRTGIFRIDCMYRLSVILGIF